MQYNYTQSDIDYDAKNNVSAFVNETTLVTAPRLINIGRNLTLVSNGSKIFDTAWFSDKYGDSTYFNIRAAGKEVTIAMGSGSGFYSSLSYKLKDGGSAPEPEPEPETITGYSLTTTEINSLKSQGVIRISVRGSDVTKTTQINSGDKIRILCGVGKTWSTPPAFINGSVRSEFTVSDRWADKTFSDNPSGDGWTSLNIGVIVSAPLYVFDQQDIDQLINSGVTLTMNGVAVEVGTAVRAGDVFLATAGANRYFYNLPDEHPSIYFSDMGQSGDDYTQYFTLSSDFKTATYTRVDLGTDVNYGGLTSLTEQKTNVVGTNNVYLINEKILKQVNAKRFKTVSDGGTSEITYDYGQFILSLLNIPFTVPAENIILPESIILSNFDTGVSAPKINVDILNISLGSITVPATNNNLYDYVNTVALLHLPRMDSVAIELEYVIGHTISIEYLLDCYTGDATVNIYSDRISSPIITKSVNIGVNIPYANTHNTASLDNGNIEVGGDNGVTTAFIELVKVDSILKDGLFTIPVIDEAVLNTATGFIQVENVELKTSALRNEKEMLINILNNGVIIK